MGLHDSHLSVPQHEGYPSTSPTPSNASTMEKEQDDRSLVPSDQPELTKVESSVYPQKWKLALIFVALCFIVFMFSLDMTVVATAIPRIVDDFKSLNDAAW